MGYENPIHSSYFFPDVAHSSGSVLGRIIGPRGKKGRLVGVGCVKVVTITGSTADVVDIGSVSDDDAYGTLTIAVGVADTLSNTLVPVTSSGLAVEIPVNTAVEVLNSGAADNGSSDMTVYIDWY